MTPAPDPVPTPAPAPAPAPAPPKKPGDGSGPLTSRLTTGRLVPVALVDTLLLGAGAIWLASRGSDPAQGDDPRAGA
ncbi:hypothetical protein ACFQ4H_13790, partial [Micromonospora sonneratiae]